MNLSLQHLEREKCGLAIEGLRSFGELRLRASGVSMLPTVIPGDLLRIQSVTDRELVQGDLVLFEREGSLFVHRLIELNHLGSRFITRGDSMAEPDPQGASRLLGKVITIERNGHKRPASRRRGTISKLTGFLLCHFALVRALFLRWQLNGAHFLAVNNPSVTASE